MPFDAHRLPTTEDRLVDEAIDAASRRIAPAWPLDRLAAVNPLWGFIDQAVDTAFANVGALTGSRLLMSREWFAAQWARGAFERRHLELALEARGSRRTVADVLRELQQPTPGIDRRALVTDVADAARDLEREMGWSEYVVGRISHVCASYFASEPSQPDGLYRLFLDFARRDRGPGLLMGMTSFRRRAANLEGNPREAIAAALSILAVPDEDAPSYLAGLLFDVGGWASVCAYRRWTAGLEDREDHHLVELLAIRIGWERMLFEDGDLSRAEAWNRAKERWSHAAPAVERTLEVDWILQEAVERAYQETLASSLKGTLGEPKPSRPAVQAAFCIDVRSEVMRRALEDASDGSVGTLGFAGFFGLPMEYRPLGSEATVPQLPGLLAPSLQVTDTVANPATGDRRADRLGLAARWRAFQSGASSTFSFVEATGLFYGAKLLSQSLGVGRPTAHPAGAGLTSREAAGRKPRLTGTAGGGPLAFEERARVAEGIVRGLSLSREAAPLVLLAGHGSSTVNNPVAAGLDCGACCGQSGEVNARAVAALLNDPEIREALAARDVALPSDTHFLPGLHDTTTDEIRLFDTDEVPSSHGEQLEELRRWLEDAGGRARRERAPKLGLGDLDDEGLRRAVERRATEWSEVRPEWGLAGNASFVIAPRERTRSLALEGRTFLHEYRWEEDPGFGILELLMTAPMVVTHWINLQYYASTVDNRRFGSGDKVLHNVVGGHLGVFEGNGGDLRVGLPLQCLHDGKDWVHAPLRLSVFVEAPLPAIDAVVEKHDTVRRLVDHGWLSLFQLDRDEQLVRRRQGGEWSSVAAP